MTEVENLKQQRSTAKGQVTRSAKRVTGAVTRGQDLELVKDLVLELEKAYSDFCDVSDEYGDKVPDLDADQLRDYGNQVLATYTDAVQLYKNAKAAAEHIKSQIAIRPIHDEWKRLASQISNTLKGEEDVEMSDYDVEQLEGWLNTLKITTKELVKYQVDMNQFDVEFSEIDVLDDLVRKRKREYMVKLKQGHLQSIESIKKQTVSTSPATDVNTVVQTVSTSPAIDGDAVLTSHETLTTQGPLPGANSDNQIQTSISKSTSQTMAESDNPVTRHNLSPDETIGVEIQSPKSEVDPRHQIHSSYTLPSASMGAEKLNQMQYTSQSQFPRMSSHVTGAMGGLQTQAYRQNVSTSSTPMMLPSIPPGFGQLKPEPGFEGYQFQPSYNPALMNTSMGIPVSTMMPGIPPGFQPFKPEPGFSQQQHHDVVAPPWGFHCPTTVGFSTQPQSGGVGTQPTEPNQTFRYRSDIRLEKTSLPTFSGFRQDWPEFKAVWRELAEKHYTNKTALAHELKKALKGGSSQWVRAVYITKPEAYDEMWRRLEAFYDNKSASVAAALDGLKRLRPVEENDYRGLVELVGEVEVAYSQLEELTNLDALTTRDVDEISLLLPKHLMRDWNRKFFGLSEAEKIRPQATFMKFLGTERDAVARLAETQSHRKRMYSDGQRERVRGGSHQVEAGKTNGNYKCAYPSHRKYTMQHKTEECREFAKLPTSGRGSRREVLRIANLCFKCFGDHRRIYCKRNEACKFCKETDHHYMICPQENRQPASPMTREASTHETVGGSEGTEDSEDIEAVESDSNLVQSASLALYPIQQVPVAGMGRTMTVFFDGGSNTTYVTHKAADRLRLRKLKRYALEVTTMGNVHKTYDTWMYEVPLVSRSGKKIVVHAYGMEKITGPVNTLDMNVISALFPEFETNALQRKSTTVDMLIGGNYFGLHPKTELARAGENLSVMEGEFGICLQGSHPELKEDTRCDSNLVKKIHEVVLKTDSYHVTASRLGMGSAIDKFIQGQELTTESNPKCGSCKCGKCPIMGQTYSFKEEQELKMIRENLEYDEDRQCWITSYPWIRDPEDLPDNYGTALGTLRNTESRLRKDPEWSTAYSDQMTDMLDRGVARKLSEEEIEAWKGPEFYISHLAVYNPKSSSTPVRIVFNSSQVHKGVSLNSVLAKGPDCYLNSLVGVLLRWREEEVALVGDIKKMFNSVHMKPIEQHCHRFLWRDMDPNKKPDVYVMTRVNFGDVCAPAISSEAIYQTANKFENISPAAAMLLKKSSYVDDLIDSFKKKEEALQVAKDTEEILQKGGFKVKVWQLSGEQSTRKGGQLQELIDEVPNDQVEKDSRVLGVGWNTAADVMVYKVALNFSKKKKGVRTGPNLLRPEVPKLIPTILTRRIVLCQAMGIYDPMGLVCPFTLISRINLRETWQIDLGWDDPLPQALRDKWISFFKLMFDLEDLRYERCLRPKDAVGEPWLIIFSDGSDLAYGFSAYIRWLRTNGQYWCRLIMAKYRIAPLTKISTPQMELNGAVLSKRARKVLEKESRFEFGKVLQVVDSETVLNMINKTSTRFKVYEGVRIGEIQAATGGNLSSWAWISGKKNTADLATRGKAPNYLDSSSEWWNGPPVLYQPYEEWDIKFGLQNEGSLPGEKKAFITMTTEANHVALDYSRFSCIQRLIRVMARVHAIFRMKSLRGGKRKNLMVEDYTKAEISIIKDMQSDFTDEKMGKKKGGQYSTLLPVKDGRGLWLIGTRLPRSNAMTPDAAWQKLLPTSHPGTRLFMKRAHEEGHLGKNATLAKFRKKFWTPHGDKVAKSVKHQCQLCRRREAVLLNQQMAPLPEARVTPAPPFNKTMVDLFGPYSVRGEVQKRISGKAYGIIFTDLTMRAVHIEVAFSYDTSSFLLALRRFASIRGWPEVIYSDPGSQLMGASKDIEDAWKQMDREMLTRAGIEKGLTWVFGPADSPWHQGAVESLVKSAKRAIHFAIHNQRLSAPEVLTVFSEAANLLNERPIGFRPGKDADINILTPNSLLLGRADATNPGAFVSNVEALSSRYHLVEAVINQFWKNWTELYAPTLVTHTKWKKSERNLRPGDVVLVADKNTFRGEYRLGLVKEVHTGLDGKVRQVSLSYKNFKVGEKTHEYRGAKDVVVTRSVQRLALLDPQGL